MSCLSLYYEHTVATMLLELCCLEEEEQEIHPPTLRVQAPLYRQGPGYKISSSCLAADFSMVAVLARAPLSLAPLSWCRLLYKAIMSPGPTYPHHMPPASLGSFRWRQLYLGQLVATTLWMASPRSWASGDPCLVPADFYKASVRDLVVIAGLGL
jgi:hypothetical protein